MNIHQIKEQQKVALAAFAYYTGVLSYVGGLFNEPEIEFPDYQDYQRLRPTLDKYENLGRLDARLIKVLDLPDLLTVIGSD